MPKYLFGRVTFYITQVEAADEEAARNLLNKNNMEKNNCPAADDLPGVGQTHKYQKAWIEQEGTMNEARPMVLKELAQVLNMIDTDGSRRALIVHPFNGKQTGPLDRSIGS